MSLEDMLRLSTSIVDSIDDEPLNTNNSIFNHDVLMLSVEEVEEHIREVVEMQKILNEASLKAELYAHHMEIEHADAIRAIVEANDREMLNERNKFDSIRYELDGRVRDLAAAVEQKDLDRQKMVAELENRYEHKLAEQVDRWYK